MLAPRLALAASLLCLSSVACAQEAASVNDYSTLLPPPTLPSYPVTQTPEPIPLGADAPDLAPPPVAEPLPSQPSEASLAPGEEIELGEPVEEPPKWYHINYWLQPPGWDTGVELGINGSSGTSNSMSLRTGGYIKRESDARKVDFDIYHNRTQAGGEETQNNAQANFRHEWLFGKSPWTLYGQSQLYYDEFQVFDLSLNLNTGVGYRILDEDWIGLTGRFGAGASREFGAPTDEWVPEAQFGMDFEQQVSETQKFYAKLDYFPEWESFSHYRLVADMGWEVELLVPSNVSLKLAATDRYDSHPGGVNPHNLNYSVLLLWKL